MTAPVSVFERSAILLGVALILGTGCDGTEGADAGPGVDAGPATIELGTGDLEFLSLRDGQDFECILGPQGGYHFLVAMRVDGVEPGNLEDRSDPSNPTTEFTASVGGVRIDSMDARYVQGLRPASGGFEMLNRLLILDIDGCAEINGTEARVEVTVTDAGGVSVSDARMLRIIPHPANP